MSRLQKDIHALTLSENIPLLEKELNRLPRINETDKTGLTILHLASTKKNTELVLFILSRPGVDISSGDNEGKTALHCACASGSTEIALILLTHGALIDATANNGWTSLHYSCLNGHLDTTRVLLQNSAAVLSDSFGHTPVYYAARYCHSTCVRELCSHSAEVNSVGRDKDTPLHASSTLGNIDIVRLLLAAGATVNTKCMKGNTALHAACDRRHLPLACLLISRGADTTIKNDRGLRCFDLVQSKSQHQLVEAVRLYASRVQAKTPAVEPKPVQVDISPVPSSPFPSFASLSDNTVSDDRVKSRGTKSRKTSYRRSEAMSISEKASTSSLEGQQDAVGSKSSFNEAISVCSGTIALVSEAIVPEQTEMASLNDDLEPTASCCPSKEDVDGFSYIDIASLRRYMHESQRISQQLSCIASKQQAHESVLHILVGKNKECPNLLWFYPKESRFRDWISDPIKKLTTHPLLICFVCPISLQLVKCGPNGIGWEVRNPKLWMKKWGPVIMTTIKVLKVALIAGRILTGIPIPVPANCDIATDSSYVRGALDAAWDVFSLSERGSSGVDDFDYTGDGYVDLVGESYRHVHEYVISAEANNGRQIILEDHLRESLVRLMCPVTGAVEWVSPSYVDAWLLRQREGIATPAHVETIRDDADFEFQKKVSVLENELLKLRETVDTIRMSSNRCTDSSVDMYYRTGGSYGGLQLMQKKLMLSQDANNTEGASSKAYLDCLERTLAQTQQQLLHLTLDFELYREEKQSSISSGAVPPLQTVAHTSLLLRCRENSKQLDAQRRSRSILMEGELDKMSEGLAKSYYFVLTRATLSYYRQSSFVQPLRLVKQRSINVRDIEIFKTNIDDASLSNSFTLLSPSKSFYVIASSAASYSSWLIALSICGGGGVSKIKPLKPVRRVKYRPLIDYVSCQVCKRKFGWVFLAQKRRCYYCDMYKCVPCFLVCEGGGGSGDIWDKCGKCVGVDATIIDTADR